MKKLLLTAILVVVAVLCFQNKEDLHAYPRMFFPTNQPTTIITPPKGTADSAFTVRMSANGNPVFIMLAPMCAPYNKAVPQVWINGVFTPIYIGSRYRIEPSTEEKVVSIQVKYNSPTKEYFDVVNATARGPEGYTNSSYEGVYSNNQPNNDRAMLTICDALSCPQ
jgi:hypothetical protein